MSRDLLFHLLREAVRHGGYNPDECLHHVEESMTGEQYDTARRFLSWCHETGTTFGWNLPSVFAQWERETY